MKINLFLYDHWKVISVVLILYFAVVFFFSLADPLPGGVVGFFLLLLPMYVFGVLGAIYLLLLIAYDYDSKRSAEKARAK